MLLLAGFVAVIVHPILTTRQAWVRPSNLARSRLELTEQKEQLYSSIRELEFDHSLGKVSDTDFETLRVDLESQAVTTLRRLDGLQTTATPDEADLTARIETDLQTVSPPATAATTPAVAKFCSSCGAARQPVHKFCAQCGGAFGDTSAA
jgi:hypothetical protein